MKKPKKWSMDCSKSWALRKNNFFVRNTHSTLKTAVELRLITWRIGHRRVWVAWHILPLFYCIFILNTVAHKPQNRDGVRDYFVTGKWNATDDANQLLKSDNVVDNSDDELFGDFVDFETGETRQNEENPQPIETGRKKRDSYIKRRNLNDTCGF